MGMARARCAGWLEGRGLGVESPFARDILPGSRYTLFLQLLLPRYYNTSLPAIRPASLPVLFPGDVMKM